MSQTEEITFGALQCASCHQVLKDPVQLPACYHILCLNCAQQFYEKCTCPECGKENPTEFLSATNVTPCYFSFDHGAAKWKCFECDKYLCGSCRINHTNGHKISLLVFDAVLKNRIWKEASGMFSSPEDNEQAEGANQSNIQCPICNGASCKHMQWLHSLNAGLTGSYNLCQLEGHLDANKQPLERKFFCTECWTPVCGDCSSGTHKNHTTKDISECGREFVMKALDVIREKLHMLISTSQRDAKEARDFEGQLQIHVTETEKELNSRKMKTIEQTSDAFDKAIASAAQQGSSILTNYRESLNNIAKYQSFLERVERALSNIALSLREVTYAEYIGAFHLQEFANQLVQDLDEPYSKVAKIEQQRLILPEMDAITTPPSYLAQVTTEVKQLKLAFSFALRDAHLWTNSMVLTDVDQCLLSVRMLRCQFDAVVLCHYDELNNSVTFKEYDVEKGTYYLGRLSSGEIVASFSPENKWDRTNNKILYFNGILPQGDNLKGLFEVVHDFHFPPYGIATTKDNNIILCVHADQLMSNGAEKSTEHNDKKQLCQVISMSLRGKILKSSLKQPDANLLKPDYVAVSDSGEICIADNENSSIVILNEDLTIKERMNYQLPTSIREDLKAYKFGPHGVCYDTLGRIIVADPNNHSVVRLVRDPSSHRYTLEPLLDGFSAPGFVSPNLVALSKDSRLWVVCTGRVFVFEYGF